MQPIFIFSLPRSGSTMLQRVLMTHSMVASIEEPWILLPIVHMLKPEGTVTVYSHRTSCMALEDLVANMNGGQKAYDGLVREFVEKIYCSIAKDGALYFLDKTPRYYLIIEEIARIFPDAKFVFLFRNPVHVYASILKTWGNNTFKKLFNSHIDINDGPRLLSEGFIALQKNAYALRYEDFVASPETELRNLLAFLGLQYESEMLNTFGSQPKKGRMGDPIGTKKYNKISVDSLNAWKLVFNNSFRKKVIKSYVKNQPDIVWDTQRYSKSATLSEIDEVKVSGLTPFSDYYYYLRAILIRYSKIRLHASKEQRWSISKDLD